MTAPADRCSTLARTLAEPLAATAPLAHTWVALEQPGPWGHQALTDSHLDPALGAELTARAEGTGVTVILVRRPGHHADATGATGAGSAIGAIGAIGASGAATGSLARGGGQPVRPEQPGPAGRPGLPGLPARPRALWIAHTGSQPWLVHASLSDPAVLLDLDFTALGAGTRPRLGEPDVEPLLLVCTNSRRDECCALIGRPLAADLAAVRPGRVWESSHLGGHRLAPVVLSLPDGFAFGGPHAGSLALASCRGRSTLPRPAQAAELAALAASADPTPRALTVEAAGADWLVTDAVHSGRAVRYSVSAHPLTPSRKESCRKGPVSSVTYTAVRIDP